MNPAAQNASVAGALNDGPMTRWQDELRSRAAQCFPTPAGRYILQHGTWWPARILPTGVYRRQAKACYRNAGKFVLSQPDHRYVEGFAMVKTEALFVVQHAWAVDAQGGVVDRTWPGPLDAIYFGVAFRSTDWARLLADQSPWDGWSLFHNGGVPASLQVSPEYQKADNE